MMDKIDQIIEYMNLYHFKRFEEMCNISVHRKAIDNIIDKPLSVFDKAKIIYNIEE